MIDNSILIKGGRPAEGLIGDNHAETPVQRHEREHHHSTNRCIGPMASLKWDEAGDGTYFAQMTVSGLRSEKQAKAAVAYMQQLFCGQGQEPSQ